MTKHRSLRARLTLGLGLLALLLTAVSLLATAALTRLGGAIGTILQENYASVIACEDMNEALERLDSAALFAATGQQDIARPMLAENRALFEGAFAREAANITLPGEGALVRKVGAEYGEYVAASDRVRALRTPPSEGYFHELLPRFYQLKTDIRAILKMNQEAMEAADRGARVMGRSSVRAALAVSALALLLAGGLALWLPAAMFRPLDALREATKRVGEGHLLDPLPAPDAHELAPLAEAFNTMLSRLRIYRESSLGELLAAKDLARTTVACLLDPVIVFNAAGDIVLTNDASEKAFGLEEGTREQLALREIVVPDGLREGFEQVARSGEPVLPSSLSQAVRYHGKQGERCYLVRAVPLSAEVGERPGVIVVAQDVTRFRRIDELKSNVVATVSHEFKTPLTSLRMATHMLLEPQMGPLTERQVELVTTARDDTERLRMLVDEFLDLTRIESEAGALRLLATSPARLLRDAVEAQRALATDKGVALEIDPAAATEPVALDPDKIGVAVANLLSNAIRHTPRGGRINIGARREPGRLLLEIGDTGEGIERGELPHVFERFRRGDGAAPGEHRVGLGLTITREIVQQHGGEVVVASERGVGTTFRVILPLP